MAPDPRRGLSAAQVRERVEHGEVNDSGERTSRTFGEIVRANVFTRFNAILSALLIAILVAGSPRDGLFGIVIVVNALIGIVQELRAKLTLDGLILLNAPRARVVRDGALGEVAVEDVVRDDVVELRTGDQVAADGPILEVEGLEIDESLLTGEAEPVGKAVGDEVLSGSIVVAGRGRFTAGRVGADAYARRLAAEARRFTLARSELMDAINLLLRWIQWAIVPTAALLALSQFHPHTRWQDALTGTVAGLVAVVPQGLVLLTSLAFAVAAVTLARRKVLVQELPAVEGLARVDVVCLDKTGTLTDGEIAFDRVELLEGDGDGVAGALGALADADDRNATMAAIGDAFAAPPGWVRAGEVAFSSARKWSAVRFVDRGTWVIGAPEMVWAGRGADSVRRRADELAAGGQRVLLLARSDAPLDGDALPPDLRAAALVLFAERIRPDAPDTLRYFRDQGVTLKVISGDNPRTVAAVARRVGLSEAGEGFDARQLPPEPGALADVLDRESVFGRVTPQQKRAMVGALQARGHVVAMTGDGVNDALALKDADIGVAMGSGAPATRAVAQIVLLDGRFATMPGVVAEGRRVIANIERVANLFVTKTVYAMLLAVAVGIARWPYVFLPRHLTVVDSLTIGIPGFFIALAPNVRRYVPGFLRRVMQFTLPTGLVAAAATFLAYALGREQNVGLRQARTAATVALVVVGLWVLTILARPLTPLRLLLVGLMIGGFAGGLLVPALREFFDFDLPRAGVLVETFVVAVGAGLTLEVGWRAARRRGVDPTSGAAVSGPRGREPG